MVSRSKWPVDELWVFIPEKLLKLFLSNLGGLWLTFSLGSKKLNSSKVVTFLAGDFFYSVKSSRLYCFCSVDLAFETILLLGMFILAKSSKLMVSFALVEAGKLLLGLLSFDCGFFY